MTQEELQAIRERAAAATPGPWHADADPEASGYYIILGDGHPLGHWWADTGTNERDDAEFAAHARTDIPTLLDHIAALEAENARMREIVVAVADGRISDTGYTDAGYCRCDPEYADEDDEHVGRWVHKPDCLMLQARAIRASASDGGNTNEPPA